MRALILTLIPVSIAVHKISIKPITDISQKHSIEQIQNINSPNEFKIIRIDSVANVYIIYAERNDTIFKILSSYKEKPNDCKPIQKDEFYELKIKSLMENFAGKLHIGGMRYGQLIIMLEGDNGIIWDLFVSENLKGLCYTTP